MTLERIILVGVVLKSEKALDLTYFHNDFEDLCSESLLELKELTKTAGRPCCPYAYAILKPLKIFDFDWVW